MVKKTVFILLISLTNAASYAQFSLRAELGQLYDYQQGVNRIGPVGIISENGDPPRTTLALVSSYSFRPRWSTDLRLRYFNGIVSFVAADLEEDYEPFGPIEKGATLGYTTFNIQPLLHWQALQVGPIALHAHIGPSLIFQLSDKRSPTFEYANGRHPNTAYVQNQLDDANRPFYVGLTYGGSISYRRFFFTVDYHDNLNNSFTEDLIFENQPYSFRNSIKYLTFLLGYQFLGKPKEQSKDGK